MDKEQIYSILNEAYFSENMHEKVVIKNMPILLKNVNIFVDIGASLGQFTYFVNKYLNTGKIIAIEADPIRYEKLNSNSVSWKKESRNDIICLHAAVSDNIGTITFHTTNSNISGGLFQHAIISSDNSPQNVNWEEITVPSITLDEYFKNEFPDLVKMDIEGSELRALKGAKKLLENAKTCFLIEIHNWRDPNGQKNAQEVFDFLQEFKYKRVRYFGKYYFTKSISFRLHLNLLRMSLLKKIRNFLKLKY